MHPLPEHPAGREISFYPRIKLSGEQSRHSAHPRVTRLRNDEVETTPRARKVGPRIVNHEARAMIRENAIVDGAERIGSADHLRLDLDGCELAKCRAPQQEMRSHPRSLADDRGIPRLRRMRER